MSAQEPLGELLEALVPFAPRTREDACDMWMKTRLTPAIAGRLLRVPGRSIACGLQECRSRGGIEFRGIP